LTIQDLGSLGELIAAIATVATLAYLATQIRRNTQSVQGSTAQSLMNLEVDTYSLIAQHASIYRRGTIDLANLDADEKVVFDQLVAALLSGTFAAFAQYQRGLISESTWTTYLNEWEGTYLQQAGFQAVWAELRTAYPEDFCQILDELGETEDAATQPLRCRGPRA
jgi:hypothetical protein